MLGKCFQAACPALSPAAFDLDQLSISARGISLVAEQQRAVETYKLIGHHMKNVYMKPVSKKKPLAKVTTHTR